MVMPIPTRTITGGGTLSNAPIITPQGRLTLTTVMPVLVATVSAATAVLYTPYVGASVPIQVSTGLWGIYTFSELTNTLSDAATNPAAAVANANYDLFVWNNAGTLTLSRGPFWSKTATVTTPVASPGIVNWTGHALAAGTPVSFSGGVLPTGIVAGTVYFVIAAGLAANAFEISATVGGSAINFTGSSSGTQTGVGGNDTARGSGAGTSQLTLQNGVNVNTVAITNGPGAGLGTYVGTIRANGTATADFNIGGTAGGGTAGLIGVWNAYNRVSVKTRTSSSTASYSYSSATVREVEGAVGMRSSFIRGLDEDAVQAMIQLPISAPATLSSSYLFGIGLDSTTTYAADGTINRYVHPVAAAGQTTPAAFYEGYPGLGFHFLSPNENGDGSASFSITNGAGVGQGSFQVALRA